MLRFQPRFGMPEPHAASLLIAARELRSSLLVVLDHVDELCDLIDGRASPRTTSDGEAGPNLPELRVERAMLAVIWRGRTCHLGNTLPFRFIERIARRPGHYVRVSQLVEELWGGSRSPSSVRSVVSDLRFKLRAAGLGDLADLIDGSNPGHYGLRTKTPPCRSDSSPTPIRRRSDRAGS
jgi:DNA-binding response OmpR family regulator